MKLPFTGCATALVTPMRSGGVDYDALARLIELQCAAGVAALVPCGTTGEAPTLSGEEKRRIIAFTVRRAGKIPVIAGCGSPSTAYAAEYAAIAENEGAAGVLAVTPYYNKATEEGIFLHYQAIAQQVKIPVIAYNVPSRTGMRISPAACRRLCEIPNLVGIKEASANVEYAAEIAQICAGRLAVYSGCDGLIAPIYAVGGQGVVSVLSCIAPEAVVRLCAACASGTVAEAARLQQALQPLCRALFSEVNPIPVKTALSMMGVCSDEMRLPLCRMGRENRHALHAELEKLGLL